MNNKKIFISGIITLFLLVVVATLSALFPDIISAFSIIGGTCSMGLVVFFPGEL